MLIPLFFFLTGCQSEKPNSAPDTSTEDAIVNPLPEDVLAEFSAQRMRDDVSFLADENLGGRIPGSFGHALARDYIAAEMEAIGLQSVEPDGGFLQIYPNEPVAGRYQMAQDGTIGPHQTSTGYNVVGILPGSDPELADEYIVVMAHYDHLGVTQEGKVFNGAFDNATSVAMGLEIARVFTQTNTSPKRTIVFLFTDDEESGLDGAQTWLENSTLPVGNVVFGISIDPTGRPVLPDFWPIVLIGLERSPTLLERWRETAAYAEVPVFFIHRGVIPVFASDHDKFFAHNDPIAAGWYVNPGMSFYHTTDDTPETIDYRVMLRNVRYIAQVLYDLGGDDQQYPYEGEPEIGTQSAIDAHALLSAVLESEVIDNDERERAEYFISELDNVIAANDLSVLPSPEGFFFAACYFVLFELTYAHPGEVPPPFPEE